MTARVVLSSPKLVQDLGEDHLVQDLGAVDLAQGFGDGAGIAGLTLDQIGHPGPPERSQRCPDRYPTSAPRHFRHLCQRISPAMFVGRL